MGVPPSRIGASSTRGSPARAARPGRQRHHRSMRRPPAASSTGKAVLPKRLVSLMDTAERTCL
eukprot:12938102-Alexandrium_andersonii.AAC.1